MAFRMKLLTATSLLAFAISFSDVAAAQDTTNFGSGSPSVEELVGALKGIGPIDRVIPPEPSSPTAPESSAISMQLTFAFDSAELLDESKARLRNVAKAMSSEQLANLDFTIEGHSDATGTDEYNQALSERRAQSVKRFLLSQADLDSDRLKTVGNGERDLLNPDNPSSAENRRVRITTHPRDHAAK